MAHAFVPAILRIDGKVGHALGGGACRCGGGDARIGHFGRHGDLPVGVERVRVADHRVEKRRIAVGSFEIDGGRYRCQVAEGREAPSDGESRYRNVSVAQRESGGLVTPEVGRNVADDWSQLTGVRDRFEEQARRRGVELELLVVALGVRYRNVCGNEVEVVGDAAEVVRGTQAHVAADTQNHFLVFARDDEPRQPALLETALDGVVIGCDHLLGRCRIEFLTPGVDEDDVGFGVVLQDLRMRRAAQQREACCQRKESKVFHNQLVFDE